MPDDAKARTLSDYSGTVYRQYCPECGTTGSDCGLCFGKGVVAMIPLKVLDALRESLRQTAEERDGLRAVVERWRNTLKYYTGTEQPEPARVALRGYDGEAL